MARDRVPFHGMNRTEFKKYVIDQGFRCKLESNWSPIFCSLLEKSWHKNPLERPTFKKIIQELELLIMEEEEKQRRKSWFGC